jgi:hypothetical protein
MKRNIGIQPIRRNFIGICFFLFLFTGCKHETTGPELYSEPSEYRHATFPLSSRNQWSYTDSTGSIQNQPILYMGCITGYAGETQQGGWLASNLDGRGSLGEYFIARDTVFARYGSSDGQLQDPVIAYLPPASIHDTAFIFGSLWWAKVKVYSLGITLSTPAGVFDSVYVYEYDQLNETRSLTYFRPGIGIVMRESYSGNIRLDKTILTAYSLVP